MDLTDTTMGKVGLLYKEKTIDIIPMTFLKYSVVFRATFW
jgi:hypothetical protein